jgi:parallel beta helix pectate lyase-like protein
LGDATIEGITFKLPKDLTIFADPSLPDKSQLSIRRNVFTDSTAGIPGPLQIVWSQAASDTGTIRVVNNLLHDNSSAFPATNAGAIFFQLNSGNPKIELINNTIVDNTGTLGGVGMVSTPPVSVYAYNNIFYGNSGKDLSTFAGSQATLVDNVIGTHSYGGTSSGSGTTTGDPKLDANFRPIESPVSNVINSGTASVAGGLPTTDLAGRMRQVGSAPDRGAFESTIDPSPIQAVTTTGDSGLGSLRAAIANANSGTGTLIVFNLGSSCPSTIHLQTALPQITSSLAIAGYSQVGSVQNDLDVGDDAVICVILDGADNNIADGLYVSPNADDAAQAQISGVAFSGFSHSAVAMYGGSAHTVTGIHIGGNVGGVALSSVGTGIIIGPGVHDVKIGDGDSVTNVSERNIIGAATGQGIVLDGATGTRVAAHDNHISNNYIGLGWNTAGSGNYVNRGNGGAGILMAGDSNVVDNNTIEFNGGYGIDLTSAGANNNTILVNKIGYLDSYTDQGSGNLGGVLLENGANGNFMNGNTIWFNNGAGIRAMNGQGNRFFENQLWNNTGLGIDLAAAGVTANDNDASSQPAGYANRGLNFPVLTGAIGGHTIGTFSGTLTTVPGTYSVEFSTSSSCDPSGYGQGEFDFFATSVTVANPGPDGQGTASFSVRNSYPRPFTYGPYITATTTDSAHNTSEFSQCLLYTDDTLFADGFE